MAARRSCSTLAALAWASIDPAGYAATWRTVLLIRACTRGLAAAVVLDGFSSGAHCLRPGAKIIAVTTAIPTAARVYVTTNAMFKNPVTDAAIFPPAGLGDGDEGGGEGERGGGFGRLGDVFAEGVRTGPGAVERDTDAVDAAAGAGPDADGTASALVERLDRGDRGVGVRAAAAGGGPLLLDAVTAGVDSPGAGAVVPTGPPADVGARGPGAGTAVRMISGWCVPVSCFGSCTAAGRLVW